MNILYKTLQLGILTILISSCNPFRHEIKELENATIFTISTNQKAILLDGVINSSAYNAFKLLCEENPTIKQLNIVNCDGSINDDINLKLSKYIYDKGFDIHLNDNGLIASGGTDLFLAGHKRTLGKNTKVGVHSWGDSNQNIKATDFPKGHKFHLPYIEYYQSIGFTKQQAEDFYYFTINSASADDIYWMTKEEIKLYQIVQEYYI